MPLTVRMNFFNPKSPSPSAICAGTWCHSHQPAAALTAQAGSGLTERGISGRSWIQSPRPGIRRQRQVP